MAIWNFPADPAPGDRFQLTGRGCVAVLAGAVLVFLLSRSRVPKDGLFDSPLRVEIGSRTVFAGGLLENDVLRE
jgi:hypothetical protein